MAISDKEANRNDRRSKKSYDRRHGHRGGSPGHTNTIQEIWKKRAEEARKKLEQLQTNKNSAMGRKQPRSISGDGLLSSYVYD